MSRALHGRWLSLGLALTLPLSACTDDGGSDDDVGTEDGADTSTGDTTTDTTTGDTTTDTTTDTTESSTDTDTGPMDTDSGSESTTDTGAMDTDTGAMDTDTGMMDTTDTTGGGLSFEADVYPVISANCSCHVGGESGGLAMPDAATAYDNLVGVAAVHDPNIERVTPGDGEGSFLYQKVAATHDGLSATNAQMPKSFGQAMSNSPLSDADQTLILDWINGGANP